MPRGFAVGAAALDGKDASRLVAQRQRRRSCVCGANNSPLGIWQIVNDDVCVSLRNLTGDCCYKTSITTTSAVTADKAGKCQWAHISVSWIWRLPLWRARCLFTTEPRPVLQHQPVHLGLVYKRSSGLFFFFVAGGNLDLSLGRGSLDPSLLSLRKQK